MTKILNQRRFGAFLFALGSHVSSWINHSRSTVLDFYIFHYAQRISLSNAHSIFPKENYLR